MLLFEVVSSHESKHSQNVDLLALAISDYELYLEIAESN